MIIRTAKPSASSGVPPALCLTTLTFAQLGLLSFGAFELSLKREKQQDSCPLKLLHKICQPMQVFMHIHTHHLSLKVTALSNVAMLACVFMTI